MTARRATLHTFVTLAALAAAGTAARAQTVQGSAALKAQAKVGADSARAVALRAVPHGRVASAELEREHGKLIYSFDIAVAGKSGVEEVHVDAMTGAVVAHEHESAQAERTEARLEAREKPAAHGGMKASGMKHDSTMRKTP